MKLTLIGAGVVILTLLAIGSLYLFGRSRARRAPKIVEVVPDQEPREGDILSLANLPEELTEFLQGNNSHRRVNLIFLSQTCESCIAMTKELRGKSFLNPTLVLIKRTFPSAPEDDVRVGRNAKVHFIDYDLSDCEGIGNPNYFPTVMSLQEGSVVNISSTLNAIN